MDGHRKTCGSALLARLEDHELGCSGHLLDATEQLGQLAVIAQMAVADDIQCAAHDQR